MKTDKTLVGMRKMAKWWKKPATEPWDPQKPIWKPGMHDSPHVIPVLECGDRALSRARRQATLVVLMSSDFFFLRDSDSKNKVKEGWRMSSSINLVLHVHVNTSACAHTTYTCKNMLVHATHEKWERRKNIPVPCCNNRWLQPHCCPASSPPHRYFWIFKQLHPHAL